jgi:type IV pilus assembly protein PilN
MIRINLLPIKQDRRREAGRNQLAIAFGVVLLVGAACYVVNGLKIDEIEAQRNKNSIVKADVEVLKKAIKDHQQILDEIKEFEKRQAAIEGLQTARTGPVYVMLELSNILSKGGRPQVDEDEYQAKINLDPAAGYDENWDFRRLWISEFSEKDRKVRISGQALTHEDVAEFLRRVNLSNFFVANELLSTDLSAPKVLLDLKFDKEAEPVVHFEMAGQVRYR